MKYYCSVFLVAFLLAGCGEAPEEQTSLPAGSAEAEPAEPAEPAESADEFIARINDELAELGRELGAAGVASLRFSFSGNGDSEGDFQASTISKEVRDLGAVLKHLDPRLKPRAMRMIQAGAAVMKHHAHHLAPVIQRLDNLGRQA